MADNRLFLRCEICHTGISIARVSAGDECWTPARTDPEEYAAFLKQHAECSDDGALHVDLQSETDFKIGVALHNPSSMG